MTVRPAERGSRTQLLLDRFMPTYDLDLVHSGVYRVPPEVCYEAVLALDLFDSPLVRALVEARALPWRLAGRLPGGRLLGGRLLGGRLAGDAGETAGASDAMGSTFRVRDMPQHGWLLLGETPDVEMVLGLVGQPWKPRSGSPGMPVTAESFRDFAEPGFLKLATSVRADPYGDASTILTLETRGVLTDAGSRRRFRPYWRVVGPFSHLIRWKALRMLERRLSPSPTPP